MLLPMTLALFTSTAEAGGVGVLATGGMHNETLYYYSEVDSSGNLYPSLADYDQYKLNETLGNAGGGLEFLLGDRDDKILGVTRFYYLADLPQVDPAKNSDEVDPEHVVAEYRDGTRSMGIGLIGLSWGIVGNPSKFQFNAVGHLGAAFLTTDHTEFLTLDVGPGVSYRTSRSFQLFADATYQMRYRKGFTHSGNLFVGARYLFD